MKFKVVRIIFIIIVIFSISCVIYMICKNNSTNKNRESQTIKIDVQYAKDIKLGIAKFDTINPLITQNKEVVNINKLIFEPLFNLDEEYKIIPCLATEFAKINNITYIIKIDTTIQWSSGEKISAFDVVYTIENLKKSTSIYKANVENILFVEAIDNSTVKIQLKEEEMFFEYNLVFPIISQKYYEGEDYFTSTKLPIGTGMLKIISINATQIILQINENWRNPQNKNLVWEKVYIYLYNTMGEVYNSFKIGNIDFINTESMNYEDYIGKIGYYVKEFRGRDVDFLSVNCKDDIVSDKFIRKAINYAIDKNKIISNVYNNKYFISEYPMDFGIFTYKVEMSNLEYNIEQAKKNLQEAGWVNSNNRWSKNGKILHISIVVNITNIQRCEVAKFIKQQLEDIGIAVNIEKVSDSKYISYLKNKNFQLILTGVRNGFSPDITYFYGKGNLANYNNAEIETILQEIKNITEDKLLIEKYKKIVEITKEEIPYICLYRNKNTILVKQNAGGQIVPNNYNIYYNFWSWHRK